MGSDTRRLKVVVEGESTSGKRALNELKGSVEQSSGRITAMAAALGGFAARAGAALAVAGSAAAAFGFQTATKIESAQVAFTNLLGSGEKAKVFLNNLQNFANSTPFEFPDLVVASQQLLAMGFNADELIPTLTAVGDAVAAMGGSSEQVDAVVRALGQMQAKGRVTGEELMQMTEQGIPALQILADKFHVSTSEMQQMISKGIVPADEGIAALVDGLENGTQNVQKFGGMMAQQSETMAGKWSTFMDSIQLGLGNLVLKAKPLIVGFLTVASNAFTNFFAGLEGKGKSSGFGGFVNTAGLSLRAFAMALREGEVTSGGFVGKVEQVAVTLRNVSQTVIDFVGKALGNLKQGWITGQSTAIGFDGAMQRVGLILKNIAAFITQTVIPAIQKFGPGALRLLGDIIVHNVLPFINQLTTVWLPALANFLITKVWPIIVRVATFLAHTFGPTFRQLGTLISQSIIPAFQNIIGVIRNNSSQFMGLFKAIGIVVGAVIVIGLKIAGWLLPILIRIGGVVIRLGTDAFRILVSAIGIVIRVVQSAWQTFQFFQRIVQAAMSGVKVLIVGAIRVVINVILEMVGAIINGAARAFGWVPGIGGKLRNAAAEFNTFKNKVNNSLSNIVNHKTITVEAHVVVTGQSLRTIGKDFAHGGIHFFQQGKERHEATLARAGDWRVWAEPETGGEAYIPLGQGKRTRSLSILAQVANRFGYSLVRTFADGGITSGSSTGVYTAPPELHIHFHGIVAGDRKAIAKDIHSLLKERKKDTQTTLGLA